ncbi:hypothetical protein [Microbacterium sp. BF1]|uniref:hypothetical protein n=1 Tax=Microbacterium sp. BF1 TaxID=2821146 RepID=UPI002119FE95|nr:hypothetical protein [Microbacterium sp. BF1]
MQWQEFSDSRQGGEFQLIVGGVIGTSVADPFQIYRDWFGGTAVESTSPVGTEIPAGRWNFSRYSNPVVDTAIQAAISTNDEATKKELYGGQPRPPPRRGPRRTRHRALTGPRHTLAPVALSVARARSRRLRARRELRVGTQASARGPHRLD